MEKVCCVATLKGLEHEAKDPGRSPLRQAPCKYDDRAMLCICHHSNLLSFAFSIRRRGKKPRQRRRRRSRRKRRWQLQLPATTEDKALAEKGTEEEEEEVVVVMVETASDK